MVIYLNYSQLTIGNILVNESNLANYILKSFKNIQILFEQMNAYNVYNYSTLSNIILEAKGKRDVNLYAIYDKTFERIFKKILNIQGVINHYIKQIKCDSQQKKQQRAIVRAKMSQIKKFRNTVNRNLEKYKRIQEANSSEQIKQKAIQQLEKNKSELQEKFVDLQNYSKDLIKKSKELENAKQKEEDKKTDAETQSQQNADPETDSTEDVESENEQTEENELGQDDDIEIEDNEKDEENKSSKSKGVDNLNINYPTQIVDVQIDNTTYSKWTKDSVLDDLKSKIKEIFTKGKPPFEDLPKVETSFDRVKKKIKDNINNINLTELGKKFHDFIRLS